MVFISNAYEYYMNHKQFLFGIGEEGLKKEIDAIRMKHTPDFGNLQLYFENKYYAKYGQDFKHANFVAHMWRRFEKSQCPSLCIFCNK